MNQLLGVNGVWTDFGQALRNTIGPVMKAFHQPIDNWLGRLPVSVGMACAIGLFCLAGIWVWTLRAEFIFRGAPRRHWRYDLRLWATLLLLPYIAIYLLFG